MESLDRAAGPPSHVYPPAISSRPRPPCVVVVMGVCGAGKTSLGRALAQALGASFVDADDFHPLSNRDKMRAGVPLTDADRWPWLQRLRDEVLGPALAQRDTGRKNDNCEDDSVTQSDQQGGPCTSTTRTVKVVLACSALREAYRTALWPEGAGLDLDTGRPHPGGLWVALSGLSPSAAAARVSLRVTEEGGHFMPPALVTSQFDTWEPCPYALEVNACIPTEKQEWFAARPCTSFWRLCRRDTVPRAVANVLHGEAHHTAETILFASSTDASPASASASSSGAKTIISSHPDVIKPFLASGAMTKRPGSDFGLRYLGMHDHGVVWNNHSELWRETHALLQKYVADKDFARGLSGGALAAVVADSMARDPSCTIPNKEAFAARLKTATSAACVSLAAQAAADEAGTDKAAEPGAFTTEVYALTRVFTFRIVFQIITGLSPEEWEAQHPHPHETMTTPELLLQGIKHYFPAWEFFLLRPVFGIYHPLLSRAAVTTTTRRDDGSAGGSAAKTAAKTAVDALDTSVSPAAPLATGARAELASIVGACGSLLASGRLGTALHLVVSEALDALERRAVLEHWFRLPRIVQRVLEAALPHAELPTAARHHQNLQRAYKTVAFTEACVRESLAKPRAASDSLYRSQLFSRNTGGDGAYKYTLQQRRQVILETLFAATDTTSVVLANILHYLASDLPAQEQVRQEFTALLSSAAGPAKPVADGADADGALLHDDVSLDFVTMKVASELLPTFMQVLRAVVRRRPVGPVIMRTAEKDVVVPIRQAPGQGLPPVTLEGRRDVSALLDGAAYVPPSPPLQVVAPDAADHSPPLMGPATANRSPASSAASQTAAPIAEPHLRLTPSMATTTPSNEKESEAQESSSGTCPAAPPVHELRLRKGEHFIAHLEVSWRDPRSFDDDPMIKMFGDGRKGCLGRPLAEAEIIEFFARLFGSSFRVRIGGRGTTTFDRTEVRWDIAQKPVNEVYLIFDRK